MFLAMDPLTRLGIQSSLVERVPKKVKVNIKSKNLLGVLHVLNAGVT